MLCLSQLVKRIPVLLIVLLCSARDSYWNFFAWDVSNIGRCHWLWGLCTICGRAPEYMINEGLQNKANYVDGAALCVAAMKAGEWLYEVR